MEPFSEVRNAEFGVGNRSEESIKALGGLSSIPHSELRIPS